MARATNVNVLSVSRLVHIIDAFQTGEYFTMLVRSSLLLVDVPVGTVG